MNQVGDIDPLLAKLIWFDLTKFYSPLCLWKKQIKGKKGKQIQSFLFNKVTAGYESALYSSQVKTAFFQKLFYNEVQSGSELHGIKQINK